MASLRFDYDDHGVRCWLAHEDDGWWTEYDGKFMPIELKERIEAHEEFDGWKEYMTEECSCGNLLGGRDDWTEPEFDEHPDRVIGYDEAGNWHCPACRYSKMDVEEPHKKVRILNEYWESK